MPTAWVKRSWSTPFFSSDSMSFWRRSSIVSTTLFPVDGAEYASCLISRCAASRSISRQPYCPQSGLLGARHVEREDGGGEPGEVAGERLAVAVDDRSALRIDRQAQHAVLLRESAVLPAVDDLKIPETHGEPREDQHDRGR